jgi:cardiolipin synthase
MKSPARRREYKNGHQAELLISGEKYFSSVEKVIDEAKHFIHFQSYIIDEDDTGLGIINALIRASKRGARVYMLLDAFGTKYLSDGLMRRIEESGILFRFFSPTFITRGFQLSLRLHSKVIVADGEVAIIGGINHADRYRGTHGKKEWLDFAVLIRGPECARTLDIMRRLWNRTFTPENEKSREYVAAPVSYPDNIKLRVLQNNWYRNKIEILKGYRSAFKSASERMIIFASYFLPGRHERKLLRDASLRGVDITIVLASESDAPVFKRATRFLYDFILINNIKIYEYLLSNLHAKVATVDGKWSTVGSYNLNHLSDYASVEINVEILDGPFTLRFEEILTGIIKNDCRQVTIEEVNRRRTLLYSLSGWISYQAIRLMMRLMFQLTSRRRKHHIQ